MVRIKDAGAKAGPSGGGVGAVIPKRPPGRPRKLVPADIELNVNQRPRRQIKHKYIKNYSYTNSTPDSSFDADTSDLQLDESDATSPTSVHKLPSPVSTQSPPTPLVDVVVKRKRGRPKKIRPVVDKVVDVTASASPSPNHHSVDILSIGNTTVELVEILPGDEDDAAEFVTIVEQPPDAHEVDTSTIDSEQYELLEVEDDSQTDFVEDIASAKPAEYTIEIDGDSQAYVIELSDLHNNEQEDIVSVLSSESPAAPTTTAASEDELGYIPHDTEDGSQNSSIISESEIMMGFDGDRPIMNGRTVADLPIPFVLLDTPQYRRSGATIASTSPAATASPPTVRPFHMAMQQLAELRRQQVNDSSSGDNKVIQSALTSSQPDCNAVAVESAPTADVASSMVQPTKLTPPNRTNENSPVPRVTRRNSILFTPKATANNLKMLAKLLGKSAAEVAQMSPKLELQMNASHSLKKKAGVASVETARPNGVVESNHLESDGKKHNLCEEKHHVQNGELQRRVSVVKVVVPTSSEPICTDVPKTPNYSDGETQPKTVPHECDSKTEDVQAQKPAVTAVVDEVTVPVPTEPVTAVVVEMCVPVPAEPPKESVDKRDTHKSSHTKKSHHSFHKKERRKSTTTTDDDRIRTPAPASKSQTAFPTTPKDSAIKSDSHQSSKYKKHHSTSGNDTRKSTTRNESESSRIRTSTASDDHTNSAHRSHKSSHSHKHSGSSGKSSSRHSDSGRSRTTAASGNVDPTSKEDKTPQTSQHSSCSGKSGPSTENDRIRTPDPTAAAASTSIPCGGSNEDPTTKESTTKANPHKTLSSSKQTSCSGKSEPPAETDGTRTPEPTADAAVATNNATPKETSAKTDRPETLQPVKQSTACDPRKPTPSPAVALPASSSTLADSAKRAKRAQQRLESTYKATKKTPEIKRDPYAILSACYQPKQVKHDASLYSIEAMRAARVKAEAEAAAQAAQVMKTPPAPAVVVNSNLSEADAKPKFASKAMLKYFDSAAAMETPSEERPPVESLSLEATTEKPTEMFVIDVKPSVDINLQQEENWDDVDPVKSEIITENMVVEVMETPAESLKVEEITDDITDPKLSSPPPPVVIDDTAVVVTTIASADAVAADEDTGNNRRRSGRIKIITETKQRSRGFGLVKHRDRVHNTMSQQSATGDGATATTATATSPSTPPALTASPSDSDGHPGTPTSPSNAVTDAVTARPPLELPYDQTLSAGQLERYRRDLRDGLALFKQIGDNEFRSQRNISKEARRMTCDCFLTAAEVQRGEFGCGEDCLNRMLMIECGVRCVVADRCTNKRFQRHQTSDCTIFKTDRKGFGLLANSHIAAGDFVMEYVGEVLNSQQFEERAAEYALEKNRHHYFMALRSDCVIDATIKGNISRFINHSCDPNAETQKWTVNGELRIGFFSTKNIAAGEEITFDYQFQRYGKAAQRCFCEADCCRGWIGEEPDSDEEVDNIGIDDDDDDGSTVDDTISELSSISTSVDVDIALQPLDDKLDKLTVSTADATETTPTTATPDKVAKAARLGKPSISPKPKIPSRPKRADIMENPDLDMSIDQLERSQLKNRAQTLQFSRLVVRAESRKDKKQMLRILRSGELACRRLFLDYHGLKLLHAWMSDSSEAGDGAAASVEDAESDEQRQQLHEQQEQERRTRDWEFRLDILQTLAVLPILNKLLLEDSKVMRTVGEWAKLNDTPADAADTTSLATTAAVDEAAIVAECDIPKLLLEENSVIQDINLDALKQIITTNEANAKRLSDAKSRIAEASPPLDRHERVLYDIVQLAQRLVTAWSGLAEVFRIPKRQRIEQMKAHERDADRNYRALGGGATETSSGGGKDEVSARRHADRFRERDRSDNATSGMARPVDPRVAPHRFRPTAATVLSSSPATMTAGYDATSPTTPAAGPHHQHAGFAESNISKMQRRQMFEAKVAAERQLAEQQHTHATKCAFFRLNPRLIDEATVPFCVNPSTNQWFGVYGNPVYTPPSHMHIKPPPQKKTTNPADYVLPQMDLPEFWTFGIDENGRLYYYHVKIRIPQWEPPIKLLPLDFGNSSTPTTAAQGGVNGGCAAAAAINGEDSSSESDTADITCQELTEKVEQIEAAIAAKRKHIDIMQHNPIDLMTEISALAKPDPTGAKTSAAHLLDTSADSKPLFKRRRCRKLLVEERSMSPRTDRDHKLFKQEMRRYRQNKEKLRRRRNNVKRRKHEPSTSAAGASDGKRPADTADGDVLSAAAGRANGDEDDDDDDDEDEEGGVTTTLVNGHVDPDDDVVVDDDDDSGDEAADDAVDSEATFGRMAKRGANAEEDDRSRWDAAKRTAKRKKLSTDQPPPQMPAPLLTMPQQATGDSALSVEHVKRIKDKFRCNVSGVIVHNLNFYRRETCTVGYISNDDDFRFLAKKLTHTVLLKELKQRNNMFDALEVTDSVRTKARDFVRKYMMKFGPIYKRSETDV